MGRTGPTYQPAGNVKLLVMLISNWPTAACLTRVSRQRFPEVGLLSPAPGVMGGSEIENNRERLLLPEQANHVGGSNKVRLN